MIGGRSALARKKKIVLFDDLPTFGDAIDEQGGQLVALGRFVYRRNTLSIHPRFPVKTNQERPR